MAAQMFKKCLPRAPGTGTPQCATIPHADHSRPSQTLSQEPLAPQGKSSLLFEYGTKWLHKCSNSACHVLQKQGPHWAIPPHVDHPRPSRPFQTLSQEPIAPQGKSSLLFQYGTSGQH